MSQRAWIRRGAAAVAASAALIMAFQPAAIAAPDWSHAGPDKYSKRWNQGNQWRDWSRWTPPAPDTNRGAEADEELPAADPVNPAPAGDGGTADEIFRLTNAERAKHGLAPLKRNDCLTSTAENWSSHMSSLRRMYHSDLSTWRRGCSLNSVGENVAYGQRSAQEVVRAWMESPGHRRNILDAEYTALGVGYADNGRYATQAFGS